MEASIFAIAALLMGIYVGIFMHEANVIYECEKGRTLTIKGAFWKGEIKYTCAATNHGDQK